MASLCLLKLVLGQQHPSGNLWLGCRSQHSCCIWQAMFVALGACLRSHVSQCRHVGAGSTLSCVPDLTGGRLSGPVHERPVIWSASSCVSSCPTGLVAKA